MARITRTPVESTEDSYDEPEAPAVEDNDESDSHPVRSGWGRPAAKQTFAKTVKAPYVDLTDCEPHIIKIHDEKPPVNVGKHFLGRGRPPMTCSMIRDDETDQIIKHCPLCKRGHKRSEKMMVNATDMSNPTELLTFEFGPEIGDALQDFTKGPRDDQGKPTYIPINDISRYWEVKRSDGARTSYKVRPLKARDLAEDFDVLPLDEDAIDTLTEKLYGKETVWINSDKQLQAAADALTDADLQSN